MGLAQKLQDDLLASMKARDALRTSVLRLLIADAKNVRVAKGVDLTEDEMIAVLKSGVKRRKESIELFEKGERADLAAKERAEVVIIESYLPAPMDAAEIGKLVDAVIAELGASSKKDLGRVMKECMARLHGRADGKVVNQLVASKLP